MVTTEPTHLSTGVKNYTCSDCGETLTEALAALTAHTFDQMIATDKYLATDATCTAPATYYYSCICGEMGIETFVQGEVLSHAFGEWVETSAPTCVKEGKEERVCKVCGHVEQRSVSATAAHTYDQQIADKQY